MTPCSLTPEPLDQHQHLGFGAPYGHCQNCLVLHRVDTVSGDTKQYERFRDTIFLNYWAIVFVQDVFLFFKFSHLVCFFIDNVFLFHCRIFLASLVYRGK